MYLCSVFPGSGETLRVDGECSMCSFPVDGECSMRSFPVDGECSMCSFPRRLLMTPTTW